MKTMLKILNFKTFGAVALSTSMLLGALAATPVTSAFAKGKELTRPDGASTQTISSASLGLDNDGDELNETGEPAMLVYPQAYNRRIDGNWDIKGGRG
jgi:hypothetical protein